MRRLWCGEDTFRFRKLNGGLESGFLLDGNSFDVTGIVKCTQAGSHAMIAQSASMNSRWDKIMAEGVHLDDRSHFGCIAIIKRVKAFCQGRRGRRFNSQEAGTLSI